MTPLRRHFIDCLQAKGFSPRTIENYVAPVYALTRYYRCSPLDVSNEQIRSYQLHLIRERKLAPATVNLHMDALQTFFRLMAPDSAVMTGIGHVKIPKRIPLVLSQNEVRSMITSVYNLKHKAALMLLYSSGLRLSECAALKPQHIESQRMKVRVEQGKGMKDRYTVLSRETLDVLHTYYRACRPKQWLFEGRSGKPLSVRMIGKVVRDAAIKAGINKAVHPHTLRHCFATHLMEAGIALPVIQKLLGHNSIKTTMIYLHVGQPQMDRVVSPLDMQNPLTPKAAHA